MQRALTRTSCSRIFLSDWYFSAIATFTFLSLGVNTLATGLIIYRIITVYREIRELKLSNASNNVQVSASRNGYHDLYPVISILIESALIKFVGQLTQSIIIKPAPSPYALIGGSVVMLYVRVNYFSIVDLVSFIYYFTGDFDDSCPCTCRDGHYLRSKYIMDRVFNEFTTRPYSARAYRIEPQSHYYNRRWGTWGHGADVPYHWARSVTPEEDCTTPQLIY